MDEIRRFYDAEGKTVEEAVEKAQKALDMVGRPLRYVIMSDGKGNRPAMIRVFLNLEEVELIENLINEFFGKLGVKPQIHMIPRQKRYYVNIITKKYDSVLIGRNGETLKELDYLLSILVRRKKPDLHLTVDVNGYRERRKRFLINKTIAIARQVRETGREMSLDPLSEYELRIVKDALKKEKGVVLRAVGKEPNITYVIAPRS